MHLVADGAGNPRVVAGTDARLTLHAQAHVVERFERLFLGLGHDTPLPAARPSALMTMGAPFSSTKDLAASSSVNTPQAAVGTPAFCMMSLAKALLPQAARTTGSGRSSGCRLSHGVHNAEGEGKLRPGNHEINDVSLGKRHQTGDVAILQGDVFASCAVPPLPGAQ